MRCVNVFLVLAILDITKSEFNSKVIMNVPWLLFSLPLPLAFCPTDRHSISVQFSVDNKRQKKKKI